MPNFVKIGGVTRKPLVDLTRNDPHVRCSFLVKYLKTLSQSCHFGMHHQGCPGQLGWHTSAVGNIPKDRIIVASVPYIWVVTVRNISFYGKLCVRNDRNVS